MLDLNIALVQTSVYWEDKDANLKHFGNLLDGIEKKTDVVLLPEMFNSGFSMNSKYLFETMKGETIAWMKTQANKLGSVLAGSIIINDDGRYYNRLVWVTPSGVIEWYDKRHLFRMAQEDKHFSEGTQRKVFEYQGWKLMPQVCYDLRFPVWSRNKVNELFEFDYDVLFYVANWPQKRIHHWNALIKARAIENQSYVLAVNRIGTDPNGMDYPGYSSVIDPLGEIISWNEREDTILYTALSKKALNEYRNLFPAWKDGDVFTFY